jgi:glycosyltransferase involved in cell wall biosynthesis
VIESVSLNTAIRRRGHSGTARAVDHIAAALRLWLGDGVLEVEPPAGVGATRVTRAAAAARWDLWDAARRVRADVHMSPCNVGMARRGQPHVVVVHDTMVLDHPEVFDPGYVAYARLLFGISVRAATRVVTASEHSAGRILARWPGAPVSVLPWPIVQRVTDVRDLQAPPYRVLMVGVTEPHKNHVLGIEAVRLCRISTGEDIRLLVVGPAGRAEFEVGQAIRAANGGKPWITRHVGVSDAELDEMYRGGWVLLQPSLAEGYGLPLAEANGWALPSVHSGAASMSEVAPGSVGSLDPWSMASAIGDLVDPGRYREASRLALEAAAERSPALFAEAVRRAIEAAAG